MVRFDHVSNAKPERLFVRRRFVLAAARTGKADDHREVLADALAIQTLAEVRIENGLIVLGDVAIDQIVNEFLTRLAVHCLPPSSCRTSAHTIMNPNCFSTEPLGFYQSREDCVKPVFGN